MAGCIGANHLQHRASDRLSPDHALGVHHSSCVADDLLANRSADGMQSVTESYTIVVVWQLAKRMLEIRFSSVTEPAVCYKDRLLSTIVQCDFHHHLASNSECRKRWPLEAISRM